MLASISAENVVKSLTQGTAPALLDVRSEGEFAQGHIAGFTNFPILADSERHQVGLTYRHEGNQKAVELGYALFNPQKTERVAAWIKHSQGGPIWVSCWRGGLRSKLSCQFISEAGGTPIQITGGYKALRALLTKPLKNPPPLYVLSGMTGNGKNRFDRKD